MSKYYSCLRAFFVGISLLLGWSAQAQQLSSFSLIGPASGTVAHVAGNGQGNVQIAWHASAYPGIGTVQYSWLADTLGAPFGTGQHLFNIPSNTFGTDTTLTLNTGTLNSLLGALGLANGDTLKLRWTVLASVTNQDTLLAMDTFRIDVVQGAIQVGASGLSPFNLLAPATNATLFLNGSASQTAVVRWMAARDSAGGSVTYKFLANVPGQGFALPLIRRISDNNGIDTTLTLTYGYLDTLVGALGVAPGAGVTLDWTVQANSSTDSLLADSVFHITILRGTLSAPLAAFRLISPADSSTIILSGAQGQTATVLFHPATTYNAPGVTYLFQAIAQNGTFNLPLFDQLADNMGMDTMVTLNYATLDSLLQANGVAQQDSITLKWRITATDASGTQVYSDTFNITLVRGGLSSLRAFYLLAPADSAVINVGGAGSTPATIRWTAAGGIGTRYSFLASPSVGNLTLSNALLQLASGNNGRDTSLTLTYGQIDTLLNTNGIAIGDSIVLQWTVLASDTFANTRFAMDTFTITFKRNGVVNALGAFELLTPPSNFQLVLTGNGQTASTNFSWMHAQANNNLPVRYSIEFYRSNGVTVPFLTLPSNLNGADTNATVFLNALYTPLQQMGFGMGDTVQGYWTVRASDTSTSRLANMPHNIAFILDTLLVNPLAAFNLVSPSTGATITTQGTAGVSHTFTWRRTKDPVAPNTTIRYRWVASAVQTGAFMPTIRFTANNGGLDTAFTITNGRLDSLLSANGIAFGTTYALRWSAEAYTQVKSRLANEVRLINIVRGTIVANLGAFTYVAPANNTSLFVNGQSNNLATFLWTSAKSNISGAGTTTYTWLAARTPNGIRNAPLFSIKSNNGGVDTMLTIPYGTLDFYLLSNNVAFGDSLVLFYTIRAVNGTDTAYTPGSRKIALVRGHTYGLGIGQLEGTAGLALYPNPAVDVLHVQVHTPAANAVLHIADAAGRIVLVRQAGDIYEGQVLELPTNGLAPGLYFLQLEAANGTAVQRFEVTR